MPGQRHGGGGWCAVLVGDGSNHRDSGASTGVGLFPRQPPLKSPLVQGGTLFSSDVAPPRLHEKLS